MPISKPYTPQCTLKFEAFYPNNSHLLAYFLGGITNKGQQHILYKKLILSQHGTNIVETIFKK